MYQQRTIASYEEALECLLVLKSAYNALVEDAVSRESQLNTAILTMSVLFHMPTEQVVNDLRIFEGMKREA